MIEKAMVSYVKSETKGNFETRLYEKIFLSSWICDFGNVIVGTTQKKTLKFKNVGDYPIEMGFDNRVIKGTEYNITPDKSKLAPG